MSKKFFVVASVVNAGIALGAMIMYKVLSAKYDSLMDKYWEGNRQIALYDNEVKKLKKNINSASDENR